nr:Type II secretion system (T2SS), protein E, N-terminal domain protein [uncultured bacterium]
MANRPISYTPQPAWPFEGEELAKRLVEHGYFTEPFVNELLAEAGRWNSTLPRIIRARGVMTNEALRDAIAYVFGLEMVEPDTRAIDATSIANFPYELVTSHVLVPLGIKDERLIVAVDDPTRSEVLAPLFHRIGLTLDLRLATPTQLTRLSSGDTADEVEVVEDKPEVDKDIESTKVNVRRKAAWIAFSSRIIAQAIGGAALVFLGIALAGGLPDGCGPAPHESTVQQSK